MWRTSQALYVAEIIGQSTAEEEANYPLFKLLVDTLHWLCQAHNGETALRRFELHLSQCLGYRPQLYECLCCRTTLQPGESFHFTPTGGGVLCHYCRDQEYIVYPLSTNALKIFAAEVPSVKPDPAAFRKALDEMAGEPTETAVVGDTINDILAAQAVPLSVIAVASPYGGQTEVAAAGPDYFIDSIADLPGLLERRNRVPG